MNVKITHKNEVTDTSIYKIFCEIIKKDIYKNEKGDDTDEKECCPFKGID